MKKWIGVIAIVVLAFMMMEKGSAIAPKIPKEAIRYRVIANSNSVEDQALKMKVKEKVENTLYTWLKDVENVETARAIVSEHTDELDAVVQQVLSDQNSNQTYTINYGLNYFPDKEYRGLTYEQGFYESLVITLGSGEGNNWWCVLFPPLCLLEADESTSDVEYRFFVKDVLDYFKDK